MCVRERGRVCVRESEGEGDGERENAEHRDSHHGRRLRHLEREGVCV